MINFEENKEMEATDKKANIRKSRITQQDYIKIFMSFSRKKKIRIAEEISRKMFDELWRTIDADLPDYTDLEELINEEVREVRYGNKK